MQQSHLAWLLLALSALTIGCGRAKLQRRPDDRVLAIVVPGTFSTNAQWASVHSGASSFGSELLKPLGPGSEIRTFLWDSGLSHSKRVAAASRLAKLIDRQAAGFDRVCIIGHSHGGNIALLAAAKCTVDIDTIVCLSTPHPHLETQADNGGSLFLPIYCSPATLDNVDSIVTICPDTDAVPEVWSNLLFTGLGESEARRLTSSWTAARNDADLHPRPSLVRLFESDHIVATKRLNVPAIHFVVQSLVDLDRRSLGVRAHQAVHSRRMGYLVGELLRDGPTNERVEYMSRLVQPKDADSGQPVQAGAHQRWCEKHAPYFTHAGWRLEKAEVKLRPTALAAAADGPTADVPDPLLRICEADGKAIWGQTSARRDSLHAKWRPRIFVYDRSKFVMSVCDEDLLGTREQLLGERLIVVDGAPPASLSAEPARDVHWSGRFEWTPLHF